MLIDILAANTSDYARMLKEGGDIHEMSILKDFIISLQNEIIARKATPEIKHQNEGDHLNYSQEYTA
jgi:hypothetical protein